MKSMRKRKREREIKNEDDTEGSEGIECHGSGKGVRNDAFLKLDFVESIIERRPCVQRKLCIN